MLSVSKSHISTNWPERTLSTNFCGKGAVAGDRLNPGIGRCILGDSGKAGLASGMVEMEVCDPGIVLAVHSGVETNGWASDHDTEVG